MQSCDSKDVILLKTFKLLLVKGYDGVSISDIQQETGLARGLLYHYFGNREQLFVEATTKYFIDMFNVDMEHIKYFDIEKMIDYVVEMYTRISSETWGGFDVNDNITMMNYDFLFYRVTQQSDEFARRYRQVRAHEAVGWEMVVRNDVLSGKISEGVDVVKTARYFIYLMDGVWMQAVDGVNSSAWLDDLRITLRDYYILLRR